jgi:nucleoside-diphosphate-sugar epimerase
MSKHLLLTGATGMVGQYLLRDLLTQNVPVAVLLRGQKEQTAEARIDRILTGIETESGRSLPRPICLTGDIAQVRLGMSQDAWRWAAQNCDRILHNAASLTFHCSDRLLDPWLSNVTGTKNLLEFCSESGIREFHYMSTAYVCGKRVGTVFEDEPAGAAPFRNDYEHSKFESEQLILKAGFLERPSIYRPPVIVGDSRTGRTTSYPGVYRYMHFVSVFQHTVPHDEQGRWRAPLRFTLTGKECRNMVTVDWVSASCLRILLDPVNRGRIYHLTPLRPITTLELDNAFSSYFKYHGSSFVGPHGLDGAELSDLEKLFYSHTAQYEGYWCEEPTFDCSNTLAATNGLECPVLDREMMYRLIDFAVRDRWGKRRKSW